MNPGCLQERPNIALGIALIASHWADIELLLGIMYTYLLAGQEPTALSNYFSQRDLNKRRAMCHHAAKLKLSPDLVSELSDLYDKVSKVATERNTIVHGLWAITDSKPDSVLLAEPKEVGSRVDKIFATLLWMKRYPGKITTFKQDISPDDYMEYKPSDLQNTLLRIIELNGQVKVVAEKVLAQSLKAALEADELPP
jgi:hypothetical protein